MRKLRHLIAFVAVLAGVLALTACGSDKESDGPAKGSQTKKSIDITFEGSSVTPNGKRVEVGVDQPVEFIVKADAAGEIHVHSDPEKELSYEKGTTILQLGSFDRPGIIEVESHTLEKTIVQLEIE